MTDTEKRVEFERELAHLINRLSLENTFGNRPDFVLATLAYAALAATAEPATTYDDLRKVAEAAVEQATMGRPEVERALIRDCLDLDAIIAKAVGR